MSRSALTRYRAVLALALLAALVGAAFQYFGLLASWQEEVFDRFFLAQKAPSDIVIVGIDDQTLTVLGGWPLAREAFATALSHLGAPRAVGIDVAFADASPKGAADDATLASGLAASASPVVLASQYDDRGGKLLLPSQQFAAHTQAGYTNVFVDADGVVRSFAPRRGETSSLSTALAQQPAASTLPATLRIDWRGPPGTVLTIPFIDVYRGAAPASLFNGKAVLIGATAKDLHDTLATPVGVMAGVEVHANALATLESGHFFTDAPLWLLLVLTLCVALAAALPIITFTRLVPFIAVLVAELVALELASVALFSLHYRLPTLALTLTLLLSAGLTFIYQYVSESREKRQIRKMFQYYLMPEVIEELALHPELLTLGGQEKKLTILFCDIRGFTTLSEGLSPTELTILINEYLTAMTDAIMGEGGLVDKYIGDAVMAFWGAPVENAHQEQGAAKGAIAMTRALDGLNADLAQRGIKPIHIGIGASTGEVVVGNMGSSKRFNYTVMGDEVNFASRLEGLTKAYGVSCIIGERTAKALAGEIAFTLRELDLVRVKGKKEPRTIYELITEPPGVHMQEQHAHFATGRAAYLKGDFARAADAFKAALALGEDGPSGAFLARTAELLADPPEHWEGVWEFTTK